MISSLLTIGGLIMSSIAPFFYGFLLAYILNMPCSYVRRFLARSKNKTVLKRKKLLSILIVMLMLVAIIVISLSFIVPAVINSVSLFIENIPTYRESVARFINYINGMGLFGLHISEEKIFERLGNIFGEDGESPLRPIMNVGRAVTGWIIAIVSAIYILFEKDRLKALAHRLLRVFTSKRAGALVIEAFVRLDKYFKQYLHTQTIDGLIVGGLATVLLFFLGSPYAIVLGVIFWIANYVPFFGSAAALVVTVIVVFFTQGIAKGAISAASLVIIQQVDATYIQPRLMSESFKLSPLLVIISITIGGAIAGILGMLVAIPIVAVLKDIFDSVVDYYEREKFPPV